MSLIRLTLTEEEKTLYHGSKQKFKKLSTDKVGSGIGQIAYGWGLYFTNIEAVAKIYAGRANGGLMVLISNKVFRLHKKKRLTQTECYAILRCLLGVIERGHSVEKVYTFFDDYGDQIDVKKCRKYLDRFFKEIDKFKPILYKVSFKFDDEDFQVIKWDEEITPKQRQVISEKLDQEGMSPTMHGILQEGREAKGMDVYLKLVGMHMSSTVPTNEANKLASLFLKDKCGILAIKYPLVNVGDRERLIDGYVVFDDNALEIEDAFDF